MQDVDLGFMLIVDRRQCGWGAVKTTLLRISVSRDRAGGAGRGGVGWGAVKVLLLRKVGAGKRKGVWKRCRGVSEEEGVRSGCVGRLR